MNSQRGNRGHLPALDGVRGLAILAVMALHYREILPGQAAWQKVLIDGFSYGYLGVDLFFVLSGFLITGILVDSRAMNRGPESRRDTAGSAHYFGVFYWRRVLRIFPAYYAYLALIFVVEKVAIHVKGPLTWAPNYWWYVGYLQNLQPHMGNPDGLLTHLWSLAVEEQFYLAWPLFVWLCPPRLLAWACGILAAMTLILRCAFFHSISLDATWRMTPFRLDSLCLGALMALWFRDARMRRLLADKRGWLMIAGGAFLWFELVQPVGFPVTPTAFTAAAVFFAAVIFWAGVAEPAFLRNRLLRRVGKYSYGMYLLHLLPHALVNKPVARFLARQPAVIAGPLMVLYIPAMMLVVFGLAHGWWSVIEAPFLRLKDRFRYQP